MSNYPKQITTIILILLFSLIISGRSETNQIDPISELQTDISIDPNLLNKAQKFAENNMILHPNNEFTEQDNIFMLLAYAVVYKDWQNNDMQNNRGYNIGSVLVNEKKEVVFWARNCVNKTKNMTEHGEVRLMTNYLKRSDQVKLKNYTIYTTLEPCAMCSGMMILAALPRTVYGQKDPAYGDALERLELDSRDLSDGFSPYPRSVKSDGSNLESRYLLDYFYEDYQTKVKEARITQFLATPEAEFVFSNALKKLQNYQIKHKENLKIKRQAIDFYSRVSEKYVDLSEQSD